MEQILVAFGNLIPFHPNGVVGGDNQIVVQVGPVAVRIFKPFGIRCRVWGFVRRNESPSLQMECFELADADGIGRVSTGLSLDVQPAKYLVVGGAKDVGFDEWVFGFEGLSQ